MVRAVLCLSLEEESCDRRELHMSEPSFCPQGSGLFGQAVNWARMLRVAVHKYGRHAKGCAICQWPADADKHDVASLLDRAEKWGLPDDKTPLAD